MEVPPLPPRNPGKMGKLPRDQLGVGLSDLVGEDVVDRGFVVRLE